MMKAIDGNPLTTKQLFGILESCWGLVLNGENTIWSYVLQVEVEDGFEQLQSFELYDPSVQAYLQFKVDSAQSVADGELLQLEDVEGKTHRFIVLFNQNIEDLR